MIYLKKFKLSEVLKSIKSLVVLISSIIEVSSEIYSSFNYLSNKLFWFSNSGSGIPL